MILNKKDMEDVNLLNINNDLIKIAKTLDTNEKIRNILNFDSNEENSYLNKQILLKPLIPSSSNGQVIVVLTLAKAIKDNSTNTMSAIINVDILVPYNNYINNKYGITPIAIANEVVNIMKDFKQTCGIKYRLYDISNIDFSDLYGGIRLIYQTTLESL